MIKTPPRTILEVFESLPEGTLAQVINNKLVMSPAPTSEHQRVLKKIFLQLNAFVESHHLGEVLFAPVDVYLDTENVYQPDIVFISNEQMHILQDSIHGAPDLIVEILSPGSQRLDKKDKKTVYERNAVKEYWIVDPVSKKVLGYRLLNNAFTEMPSEDSVIESQLLGTTIYF
jgi:Uma2 family endonuclease